MLSLIERGYGQEERKNEEEERSRVSFATRQKGWALHPSAPLCPPASHSYVEKLASFLYPANQIPKDPKFEVPSDLVVHPSLLHA